MPRLFKSKQTADKPTSTPLEARDLVSRRDSRVLAATSSAIALRQLCALWYLGHVWRWRHRSEKKLGLAYSILCSQNGRRSCQGNLRFVSSIEGGGRYHICLDDRLLPRRSMGQPGMKNYDVVYPVCEPIRLESSLESRGGREPSLGRVGYRVISLSFARHPPPTSIG